MAITPATMWLAQATWRSARVAVAAYGTAAAAWAPDRIGCLAGSCGPHSLHGSASVGVTGPGSAVKAAVRVRQGQQSGSAGAATKQTGGEREGKCGMAHMAVF